MEYIGLIVKPNKDPKFWTSYSLFCCGYSDFGHFIGKTAAEDFIKYNSHFTVGICSKS